MTRRLTLDHDALEVESHVTGEPAEPQELAAAYITTNTTVFIGLQTLDETCWGPTK